VYPTSGIRGVGVSVQLLVGLADHNPSRYRLVRPHDSKIGQFDCLYPADPGTQLREKRASSMYTYGNSQGWLIRATGCYLMQRKTPTSRSIGNKAVLLGYFRESRAEPPSS
jgi:hypothetical protein